MKFVTEFSVSPPPLTKRLIVDKCNFWHELLSVCLYFQMHYIMWRVLYTVYVEREREKVQYIIWKWREGEEEPAVYRLLYKVNLSHFYSSLFFLCLSFLLIFFSFSISLWLTLSSYPFLSLPSHPFITAAILFPFFSF